MLFLFLCSVSCIRHMAKGSWKIEKQDSTELIKSNILFFFGPCLSLLHLWRLIWCWCRTSAAKLNKDSSFLCVCVWKKKDFVYGKSMKGHTMENTTDCLLFRWVTVAFASMRQMSRSCILQKEQCLRCGRVTCRLTEHHCHFGQIMLFPSSNYIFRPDKYTLTKAFVTFDFYSVWPLFLYSEALSI